MVLFEPHFNGLKIVLKAFQLITDWTMMETRYRLENNGKQETVTGCETTHHTTPTLFCFNHHVATRNRCG